MKESARVAMIKMKYSASLRRAEFSRARRAASWTTFQLGDVVYFYRVQKMAGRGTKRKRLVLNQWRGPGMIMALEGGKVPTGAYVAYRGNLTKCAIEHLRPASTLERLSAAEWEKILSEAIHASGPDELPEDPAEPGDDHDDDHDDYDPTEPDVDRDGDGGGNDDEDQVDQGGGDHPGHDGLVPRTGDAGKRPPAVTYPFPFQASEMIPLLASSAAGSRASSLVPSRRTSQSSMPMASSFSGQSSTTQTDGAEGDAPKLPAVPEEEEGSPLREQEPQEAPSTTALNAVDPQTAHANAEPSTSAESRPSRMGKITGCSSSCLV